MIMNEVIIIYCYCPNIINNINTKVMINNPFITPLSKMYEAKIGQQFTMINNMNSTMQIQTILIIMMDESQEQNINRTKQY